MLRQLTLTLLFALPALGQLQLFQFDGANETAVGSVYQVPPAAPGDTIETRFRIHNTGAGAVTLSKLAMAGQGFQITAQPSLGYIVAPGLFTEFKVAFSPVGLGSYSATLQINSSSYFIRGTAIAAATVGWGSGTLSAGSAIDFGKILRGTTASQTITLSSMSSVTIGAVSVTGAAFQGPVGMAAPLTVSPGQPVTFQIVFAPQSSGPLTGQLQVDQRTFPLTGVGLDPPLPTASIQLGMKTGASAQQSTVAIALGAPSQVAGTGTLTMAFQPSVTGVADDPAVQFLSGPQRVATVTIAPGDSVAKFGASQQLAFQTGTTAGTMVFTLKLPNGTQTASLTITPAAVTFDTASGTRRVSDLDVSLTGFDNTYSASQLAFSFYDKTGKLLAPGVVTADETAAFQSYFKTGQAGGSFALRATFPVTGDATQVAGVDVAMTNSVGVTKTQRILF